MNDITTTKMIKAIKFAKQENPGMFIHSVEIWKIECNGTATFKIEYLAEKTGIKKVFIEVANNGYCEVVYYL